MYNPLRLSVLITCLSFSTRVQSAVTCKVGLFSNAESNVGVGEYIDKGEFVTYTCKEGFENNDGEQRILLCGSRGLLEGSIPNCKDINECEGGTDNCEQVCTNTAGSFECTCNTGFTLDINMYSCSAVTCTVPHINNAQPNVDVGESIDYGDSVTYTCNEGFANNDGAQTVLTCGSDGELEGSPPDCQQVTCATEGVPNANKAPDHVTINGGENVIYTCHLGYKFSFQSIGICEASSEAGGSTLCSMRKCAVTVDTLETKEVHTCASGDNVQDITSIYRYCNNDGSLRGDILDCSPVQCEVPIISNGVKQPSTVGQSINFEGKFTLVCDSGYHLETDHQTTVDIYCLADGSLSVPNPECTPISSSAPSVRNAKREPDDKSIYYPNNVIFEREKGYELPNAIKGIQRQSIPCSVPTVQNAIREPNEDTIHYPSSVTFTCEGGYQFSDGSASQERSCENTGELSGELQECAAVSCSVPNVQNAIRQPDADIIHYPSSVTFTCEDGYLFPDGSASQDRSCENTGELSGELHECAAITCSVPSVSNARREPGEDTINFPSSVTFTCEDGYQFPDGSTSQDRSCANTGELSGTLQECVAVTCPIEAVDNAEIYPANQDHINFDTSAIYVCNNGYAKTEGDNIRKCEANKQLSGEPLICSIVKCRAAVCGVTSNPADEYVNFNTEVVYTCDEGYHMSGDEKQKCQADGTMHGNGPVCSTVTCDTPPVPNASKPNKNEIHFLETIVYKCDPGFELTNGDLTRTCESSGELSGETPECSDTDECATDPTPCKNGKCKNSEGTFSCDCTGTGYIGTLCQHKSSKFIEERLSGLLNILITAPYGGDNMLASITPVVSDRHDGCYDAGTDKCMYDVGCAPQDAVHCEIKNAQEIYSKEIALKLYQKIYARTGYHPKLLLNRVHPSKLDVDVGREEGTFNQDLPAAIYDDYHAKLASAIESFSGPGLVITVRTYNIDGEIVISLGYMLTADELNNNDEAGLEGLIGSSSMQHVPAGVSFNDLIRGNESLGARMEDRGLAAVPSPANPGPGTGLYFSNKNSYIAKTHRDVINVLGLYIPLFRDGVDDDQDCGAGDSCVTRRTIRKVARAILEYYQQHYEVNYCEPNPCQNDGVCDNLADGFHCECTRKWRGKRCQTVNRLRTIRMKLKVKFPVEVTVDLNDPDQNLEVKATVLQQFKAKWFKRFKRRGNMRKLLISKIRKGSLNVEIDIEVDDTPESLIDATVSVSGLGQDTFIFFDTETKASNISLDGVYVSTSPSAEDICRLYTAVIGGECPGGVACVVENSIPKCQEDVTDDLKNVFTSVMAGVLVALVLILAAAIVFAAVLKYKTNRGQKVLPLEGPASAVHAAEKIYN